MTDNKTKELEVFYLAKALNYANATEFYLQYTIVEGKVKGEAKLFLNILANRAKSIITDVRLRLKTQEAINHLMAEMKDPLYMESMMNGFLCLTPENRLTIEKAMSDLIDEQIKKRTK